MFGGLGEGGQISFVYLSGFLLLILLALIPRIRQIGFAKTLQMSLAWVVIFGGLVLIVAEWDRIRGALDPASPVVSGEELRVQPRADGHFYIRGQVNGVPVLFLVDTGATDIVLTEETAGRAGYPRESLVYDGAAQTANGMVPIAGVRLDTLEVGSILLTNQPASVNPGALDTNLLGMRFLNALSGWRVEQGELILTP